MSKFPHLPLFTDAFIADTMQLSAAETGAYLMLMMCAWRSPGCRLPNNDVQLARFARVEPRHWPRIKAAIMPYWTLDEEGFWINKRLLKEHAYCCRIAAVARQNGAQHRGAKSLKTKEGDNPAGNPAGTQIDVPIPRKKKKIPPSPPLGGRTPQGVPPSKGSALPQDWNPKDRHFEKAGAAHRDRNWVDDQAEAMREWADSNRNRPVARKADWDRTFDGWLRRELAKPLNGVRSPFARAGPPDLDKVQRLIAERAEQRAQGIIQ